MNSTLLSTTENENSICGICLETFVYPCELTCGHIFCFLCIKGWLQTMNTCAMCRGEISADLLKKPNIISLDASETKKLIKKEPENNEEYVWYYAGFNGYWQYDKRTNAELEKHYQNRDDRKFQMMIAGHMYIIDFDNNLQMRVDDPNKKRKIKRDLRNIPQRKGVAGISS